MRIELAAHAKINLTLHITGKREDGYHTLNTVMQSLKLADRVYLQLTEHKTVTVTCSRPELAGENNLAHRAASTFLSALPQGNRGVSLHIEKHIPVAAGLGGGSADAAAVLTGLNLLFHQPFSPDALQAMGLSLGADVPFCMVGGTCLVTGVGEQLAPMRPALRGHVVLVTPCRKASTGEMYRKYDEIKGLSKAENCVIIDKIKAGSPDDIAQSLHNDFLPLYDGQAVPLALQAMKEAGALGACLSGSGPTVFGLFADVPAAQNAAAVLQKDYPECIVTAFADRGLGVSSPVCDGKDFLV